MSKNMIMVGGATVTLILLLRLDPGVLALLLGMAMGVALCVLAVVAVRFCDPVALPPEPADLAAQLAECDRKQAIRLAAWEAGQQ